MRRVDASTGAGWLIAPASALPDDPASAARWHRRARTLRWSAGALLLTTLPVARWALTDRLPVVLGDLVVQPTYAGAALAALGSTGAVLGALAELRAQDVGARAGSRRWSVRWPVNACKALVVAVAWCAAVVAFWSGSFSSDLRVLDPASASGCRVAVLEGLGGGTVAVLAPGATTPVRVGTYSADDGYAPVSRGAYALAWDGEVAHLDLRGTADAPVWFDDGEPIDCRE